MNAVKLINLPVDEALTEIRKGAGSGVAEAMQAYANRIEATSHELRKASVAFKEWLTLEDVAVYLGKEGSARARKEAVYRLHRAGLPYVKIAGDRLTKRGDLEAFLAKSATLGATQSS